jgi:hypothetical protein
MANEFIIKNGFVSKGNSIVEGNLSGQTFNLINTPVNNNAATEILVRNSTTGNVEYRDSSTLSGGGGGQTITGYTYNESTNTFSIEISGGTSFDTSINQMSGVTITNNLIVSGNTGMGTDTPTETLHIDGTFRLEDGNQNDGYVLTSDSTGVGSWLPVTAATPTVIYATDLTGVIDAFDSFNAAGSKAGIVKLGDTINLSGDLNLNFGGGIEIHGGMNAFNCGASNVINISGDSFTFKQCKFKGSVDFASGAGSTNSQNVINIDMTGNRGSFLECEFVDVVGGENGDHTSSSYFPIVIDNMNTWSSMVLSNIWISTRETAGGSDAKPYGSLGIMWNKSAGTNGMSFIANNWALSGLENADESTKWVSAQNAMKILVSGSSSNVPGTGGGGGFATIFYDQSLTVDSDTTSTGGYNSTGWDRFPTMWGVNINLEDLNPTTSPLFGTQGDIQISGNTAWIKVGEIGKDTDWVEITNSGGTDTFVTGGIFPGAVPNTLVLNYNTGGNATAIDLTDLVFSWSDPVVTAGNTSVDCIDQLWVHTISGCSPVTIGSSIQDITSTATGTHSIAYGSGTTSSGDYSHAEGYGTEAEGDSSHSQGTRTFAGGESSHAGGHQNTEGKTLFINNTGGFGHYTVTEPLDKGIDSTCDYSAILGGVDHFISDGQTTSIILGGNSNSISGSSGSANQTIIGGNSNRIYPINAFFGSSNNIIAGGNGNFINSSSTTGGNSIMGGKDHLITGNISNSSIIGGEDNVFNSGVGRSVILGGTDITGSSSDTVYVPNLNIKTVGVATPLYNIGIDSDGNVVKGTTSGGGGGSSITAYTYNPTNNTFSIGVSGSTSLDSQILEVSGITVSDSITLGEYIIHSGDTNTYFGFNGTDSIVAFTNASRKLRIGTNAVDLEYNGNAKLSTISTGVFVDGKLGVGTDSPITTLDVRGDGIFSNTLGNTSLTLSAGNVSNVVIDLDNTGTSSPFARIEGSTFGGGTSGNLVFSTYPTGGPLTQGIVITNNGRVGIGEIDNNDVESKLHVDGGNFLVTHGQRLETVLNTNTPYFRLSGDTNDLAQLLVTTDGQFGIGIGSRGISESGFPGYGKVRDGFLYSSNAQNGLNIISSPGTDTEDYIKFFAGNDANGTTSNMFIAGTGSTKGFVGINTESPTERLHIAGSIRIVDGTEQNGYVLTSDATGVSSWQPASGATGTSYWALTGTSNEVLVDAQGLSSYNINGNSPGAIIAGGTGHTLTDSQNSAIVGGMGNTVINSSSLLGIDTHIGGVGSIISGGSITHYGNINIGGSANVIIGSKLGAMLSTTDSKMVDSSYSFIIGGGNHKGGATGYGLYQNSNSGIIGGTNNTFASGVDRSVIIGGNGLSATTNDTVYVPKLNINSVGSITPDSVNLGLDSNGNVVTGTTGGGTPFSWSDPVVTSGNTSGNCISDLWVSNIHSCSPLYINPGDEGNVYYGSSSGITIDIINKSIGINTNTPLGGLDIRQDNLYVSNEVGKLTLSSTTLDGNSQYTNNLDFVSAGGIEKDAQIKSVSTGIVGNLVFGTTPATGVLTDWMTLTARGRLGLGTLSPDSSLHISGSGISQINVVSSDNNAILKLKSSDSANAYVDFEETSGNRWLMGSYNVNDKFVWATGNTFSAGSLMGLTTDGDLGIGNISPSSRLHVNKSSLPSLPTLGIDNVALFESDNITEVAIVGSSSRNVRLAFGDEDDLKGEIVYENATDQMTLKVDNTTLLTLNSSNIINYKPLELREFGTGTPTFNLQVRETGSGGYVVVTGATGGDSGNCITDLWVTNLESCSPLNINTQNQGNVYIGSELGLPLVTIDITTPDEPGIYFGEESFIRYEKVDKKLVIGEEEADGTVVIAPEGLETLEVGKTTTRIKQGDFETDAGNIVIKSGSSNSLIVEDIPDVGGANLGTDVDGKLIDVPSDSRVKRNITKLNNVVNPLKFMQQVEGYQFEFLPETRISSVGKKHYGFKVDDFRDNLILGKSDLSPEEETINNIAKTLVKKCSTKFNTTQHTNVEVDGMNYIDLIPFIVESIKELDNNVTNINSNNNSKFVTTQTLSSGQTTINHNLNDENVIVQVIEVATEQLIIPNKVSLYLPNSVDIDVVESGEYKIIIMA